MKPTLVVDTYDFDDRFAAALNSYIGEEVIPLMLEDEEFKSFALDDSGKMKFRAVPCEFHQITPAVTFQVNMNQHLKDVFPSLMKEASKRVEAFIAGQKEQFPEINVLFPK